MEYDLRISVELGLKNMTFQAPCGIGPKQKTIYGIRPKPKAGFGFSPNQKSIMRNKP